MATHWGVGVSQVGFPNLESGAFLEDLLGLAASEPGARLHSLLPR